MPCIYKIQNKQNGKVYIGQTMSTLYWRLHSQWIGHFTLAFERNSSMRIHKALRKYGKDNFTYETLEEKFDGTFEEQHKWLDEREIFWIEQYNSFDRLHGYNSTKGGTGVTGYRNALSEEAKKTRRSTMTTNQSSPAFKKWINNGLQTKQVHKDLLKEYLDNGWKLGRLESKLKGKVGKKHSEASKLKMSLNRLGKKKPESFGKFIAERNKSIWMKQKVSNAMKGRKKSIEAIHKMSISKKGKKLTEQQKQKKKETYLANHSKDGPKVWINNGFITKWIFSIELNAYLDNGWQKGRLKLKKHKLGENNV